MREGKIGILNMIHINRASREQSGALINDPRLSGRDPLLVQLGNILSNVKIIFLF